MKDNTILKGFNDALLSPELRNVLQGFEEMSLKYSSLYNSLHSAIDNMHLDEIVSSVGVATIQFSELINRYVDEYYRVKRILDETIGNILRPIEDAVRRIPVITDERKEELLESYKTWGEYGWTVIPQASLGFFNQAPTSRVEANKAALSQCTNTSMKVVFDETLKLKKVRLSDYNEAVADFNDKRYKSCAMILFALIDSNLVRLQEKAQNNKRRPSGVAAARSIRDKVSTDEDIKHSLFMLLDCTNLFSALQALFKDGNDFREQPETINRNFLDHGMLHRKVKRMDCIQLFLLYFNLLEIIELYKV